MRNKKNFNLKVFMAFMLTIIVSISNVLPVMAQGNVVIEEKLNKDVELLNDSLTGNMSINDFFWPDADGRYYVTESNVTTGKDYMIFVVAGKIDSLDNLESDEIVRNMIYINQAKAVAGEVSFNGFKPLRAANSTVIISGEDISPRIVGYISRDYFSANGYCTSEDVFSHVDDCYTVPQNTAYEDVLNLLPGSAYALVQSQYTDNVYVPVSFTWSCDDIYTPTRGKTFAFTAQATITGEAGYKEGIECLLKPLTVSVTIADEFAGLYDISVSKDKVIYQKNSQINYSDIHVRGYYDDGTVRTISEWTINDNEISTANAGEQILKITAGGITKNIKLVIVDDLNTATVHQVSFDSRGGSYVAPVVVSGKLTEMPAAPIKNGFRFTGWFKDILCTERFDSNAEITQDTTLYAGWISQLSVYPEFLSVSLGSLTVDIDDPLDESQISVLVSYSNGYTTELDEFDTNIHEIDQTTEGEKTLIVSAIVQGIYLTAESVFYVIDTANTEAYVVSFDTGVDGLNIKPQIVMAGMTAKEPAAPSQDGFVFLGWLDGNKLWDFSKPVKSDMTLSAKWLIGEVVGDSDSDFFVYTEERQNYTYAGAAIKPVPVVMDNNLNVLVRNRDYTLSYENNKNASTAGNPAKIIITGKGSYSGSITKPFVIEPRQMDDGITVKLTDIYAYKDAGITPNPTVTMGSTRLKKNVDYDVTYYKLSSANDQGGMAVDAPLREAGTYRVKITGRNNFAGNVQKNIVIGAQDAVDLSKAKITLGKNSKSVNYTGYAVTVDEITITGTAGRTKKTLLPGQDYELVYNGDHTNPGKVSVTARAIDGNANCYGYKDFSFTIVGIPMSSTKISVNSRNIVFDGKVHNDNLGEVSIKVTAANKDMINRFTGGSYAVNSVYKLVEGRDFSCISSNSLNVGTAKITAKGIGLFSGEKNITFNITARSITDGNITVKADDAMMSKAGAVPNIAITYQSGDNKLALQEGIDYKVSYSKNTSVNKAATAKITGMKNYKGSRTVNYLVTAKDLRHSDVEIIVDSIIPNKSIRAGGSYKPTVIVKDNGKTLKAGRDYTVDYSGCVKYEQMKTSNLGEGYVIVKGNNKDYTGTVRTYYNVTRNNISSANIVIDDQIYTGKNICFEPDDSGKCDSISAVVVVDGVEKELVLGKDFKITAYSNNIRIGKATVTMQGIGEYAGTKKVSFKIVKCPIH